MLRYHLLAIFTLTLVLVIYVFFYLFFRSNSFLTPGLRCIHSDTAACLVNRGKITKKKGGIRGIEVVT